VLLPLVPPLVLLLVPLDDPPVLAAPEELLLPVPLASG
jgi:hypothetical protein